MSQFSHQQPSNRVSAFEHATRPVVGFSCDYISGWQTGLHAHPRAQLLYAIAGVMRIEAERASYIIPPGTGLYLPASTDHSVRMDGPVLLRALFLHDDARLRPYALPHPIGVSNLLREIILAACEEPIEWSLEGRGRHLAALAIDEIARAKTLPLSLPVPQDARVRRVTDALLADPRDMRDLPGHAAKAGASPRTLARLFQRETGMGFQQWRRLLRLTEALASLAAGESRSHAASVAGYASLPAFGAAFRSTFGTTPGALGIEPAAAHGVSALRNEESPMADTTKTTGTTNAPNPKTGSSDAARGLGGHSKDASHKPGAPAEMLDAGKPVASKPE